ncbi:MAG: dienelactone hydrolase family protein [Acidimicrobiia bacterium]|nr:dienelactone hydrolase family protein [Acidimicrobiia bacterium]
MGEMVTFASNSGSCQGYLADGGGPGAVVIQEWWGLVPHIIDVTDRFGDAGFTAIVPDLYRGETTTEPDGAGKLMMALNIEQAAKDMSAAVDLLVERTGGDRIGVVGYCMGGGLALMLGTLRPDVVKAVAPYYGLFPWESAQPDWSRLEAKVVGEYASEDESFPPEQAAELEATLRALGKDATLHVHEGCQHAFFNDSRPEVYSAEHSLEAWERTNQLFREELADPTSGF